MSQIALLSGGFDTCTCMLVQVYALRNKRSGLLNHQVSKATPILIQTGGLDMPFAIAQGYSTTGVL